MIDAVSYRFRAELRTRWLAWAVLAVVVAVVAGAVMAFAAGARRTASSYERFHRAHNGYDVLVVNYPEDGTAVFDFDELARVPQVLDSARASFEYYTFFAGNIASEDGRIGTEINRFKIIEGRAADPEDPAEIVVGFALAEERGLEVGDTANVLPADLLAFLACTTDCENPYEGEITEADIDQLRSVLEEIPAGQLRIVGIEASPGEFPPQFAVNRPLVHLTPAAHRLLGDGAHEALMVRLHDRPGALDDFLGELEARGDGREPGVLVHDDHARLVQQSIDLQATSLWGFAALAAFAGALVIMQLVVRLTHIEAADLPTLLAVGVSSRQATAVGGFRGLAIGGTGAALGAMAALAVSPLFPTGLARTAEPNPGFAVDGAVVAIGAAATILLVAAAAVVSARRTARAARREDADRRQPSQLASLVDAGRVPVSAAVGARMALEPGRGRSAVPVRSSIASVVLATTALATTVTFGANLAHLLDTPERYGVTWDAELASGSGGGLGTAAIDHLVEDDRIESVALSSVNFAERLEVGGEAVDAILLEPLKGGIAPVILDGRAPRGAHEVALGRRTLRAVDADIGDVLTVRAAGGTRAADMTIVGAAVFPTVSESTHLGDGALITIDAAGLVDDDDDADGDRFEDGGFEDGGFDDSDEDGDDAGLDDGDDGDQGDGDTGFDDDEGGFEGEALGGDGDGDGDRGFEDERPAADQYGVVVRLAPGARLDDIVADLAPFGLSEDLGSLIVLDRASTPIDIVNFARVDDTPLLLAATFALIALASLVHVLATAVRRRRRDLAILRSLGLVRRQLHAVVLSQAGVVVGLGLALGLPVGTAIGRLLWRAMADNLGIATVALTPVAHLAVVVIIAVVVTVAVAWPPGRAAGRTIAAAVLRAD